MDPNIGTGRSARPALRVLFLSLLLSGCVGPSLHEDPGPTAPDRTQADSARSIGGIDQRAEAVPVQVPEIRLKPSHGSARVRLPADDHGYRIEYGNEVAARSLPVAPGNTTVTIPFLGPGREYWITVGRSTDGEVLFHERFRTTAAPFTWAPPDEAFIFPGANIAEGCTLGFILRDATNDTLYALTAGHCGFDPGADLHIQNETDLQRLASYLIPASVQEPALLGWSVVAEVRTRTEDGGVLADWGLIEIAPESRRFTSPSIPRSGAAQGVADPNALADGDPLCHMGRGNYLEETEETRSSCGPFRATVGHEGNWVKYYPTLGPTVGFSGSPVFAASTGAAVGILTHSDIVTSETLAFAVCRALAEAREKGFDVALVDPGSPWTPPDEVTAPALPYIHGTVPNTCPPDSFADPGLPDP